MLSVIRSFRDLAKTAEKPSFASFFTFPLPSLSQKTFMPGSALLPVLVAKVTSQLQDRCQKFTALVTRGEGWGEA